MKPKLNRLQIIAIVLFTSITVSAQNKIAETLQETKHQVFFADYSPDGKYIVTTGSDNNIIIWNTNTSTIFRTLAGLKKRTNAAVFTGDGKTLITAGEDNLITIWNPTAVKVETSLAGHVGAIKTIAISPDDKLLASAGEDKTILIWNLDNRTIIRRLSGHKKTVNSVMFSHDGKRLVSGSADKTLRVWDVSTGMALHAITAHKGWIRCVAYSPDDRLIASGGDDNMIYIWTASDMHKTASLSAHTDWVQTLDFSPGGNYLISGGHDQCIILWDITKQKMIRSSIKQGQIVLSTKFSPDSRNFLSNKLLSEEIRIWVNDYPDTNSVVAGNKVITAQRNGNVEPKQEIKPEVSEPESKKDNTPLVELQTEEPEDPVDLYPQISIFSPVLTTNKAIVDQPKTVIIGRIKDPDGINVLLLNKVPAEVSEAGVFEIDVELKKGENSFDLVAISNAGKLNRQEFTIECTAETTIPAKAVVPELYKGTYHALIIAVNDYDDPNIIDLDRPLQDAEKLKEVLISKYIFDPKYIHFLKNPTRMEIIVTLDELSRTITETDNLLIFYAGHGYWDEKGAIGYWLPRDAMNNNTANWFRNSTMRDFIGSIKSKHTILIADACFSGSIFKSRNAFSEPPGGITKLYGLTSRKAMTSGTLELVPDESVFLKYLIKRLEENTQKFLSSEELFSSLKTAVLNNSPNVPQFGTIQNVGDEGGDFIFIMQ